jgi:hypothetical protein
LVWSGRTQQLTNCFGGRCSAPAASSPYKQVKAPAGFKPPSKLKVRSPQTGGAVYKFLNHPTPLPSPKRPKRPRHEAPSPPTCGAMTRDSIPILASLQAAMMSPITQLAAALGGAPAARAAGVVPRGTGRGSGGCEWEQTGAVAFVNHASACVRAIPCAFSSAARAARDQHASALHGL